MDEFGDHNSLQDSHEDGRYRRIEVITGRQRRRSWSAREKAEIVSQSAEPGVNISEVARRWGVNKALLYAWRRQAGLTSFEMGVPSFVPITVSADEPADRPIAVNGDDGGSVTGRIEVEIGAARVVVTGNVDPALASAVVAALRGSR
jgi:transposase